MNKIKDETKSILIENVIKKLNENDFKHQVSIIKRQSDLTKKYKRAQSYIREFKQLFDGCDLTKESIDCNLTSEKIDEIDNGIIELITNSDKDSEKMIVSNEGKDIVQIQNAISDNDLINKALKFGIDSFDKDFINSQQLDMILVGFKCNSRVYYCNSIDNFLIVA